MNFSKFDITLYAKRSNIHLSKSMMHNIETE